MAGAGGDLLQVLLRGLPDDLGRYAHDQRARRKFLPLRHDRASGDDRAGPDPGAVEDDRAHPDQAVVADLAAMEDRAVAGDDVAPTVQGNPGSACKIAPSWTLEPGADRDLLGVAAEHGVEPDTRAGARHDIADEPSTIGNIGSGVDLGARSPRERTGISTSISMEFRLPHA